MPNQIAERMGNAIQTQNLTKKKAEVEHDGWMRLVSLKSSGKKVLNGRMRSVVEKELFSF